MSELESLLHGAAELALPQRLELLADALRQHPRAAAAHRALAAALRDGGRLEEAGRAAQRAVQLRPDDAAAHGLLAMVLAQQQRWDRAILAWETALRLAPKNAQGWAAYADTLGRAGKLEQIPKAIARELALRPNHGRALVDMGRTFELRDRLAEAERWYRLAAQRDAAYAEGWNRLGVTLGKMGRLREGVAALARGVELAPESAEIWNDLAVARQRLGDMAGAEEGYRRLLALRPRNAQACIALAGCLRQQGRLAEARQAVEQALEIDPRSNAARSERGLQRLLGGDLPGAWDDYECRYEAADFPGGKRSFSVPRWDGGALGGKTIMLWAEQGLGDTLQFLRYVPQVAAQGGRVMVETLAGTERLARTVAGVERVILKGQAWPPCDVQMGLMRLPWVCKTVETTIPRAVPYLRVEETVRQTWAARVGPGDGRRRIGLAWAGSAQHSNDKNRSVALETLRPWLGVAGVEWFSLQKGLAKNQMAGMALRDEMAAATDFMETAGLIEQLDLVISVDTAVVHLAGALGKPVWVLLPAMPDWRWMLQREDTPWYPSARLFRQAAEGDWAAVVERVREELGRA